LPIRADVDMKSGYYSAFQQVDDYALRSAPIRTPPKPAGRAFTNQCRI
jgi:hypothetical protein